MLELREKQGKTVPPGSSSFNGNILDLPKMSNAQFAAIFRHCMKMNLGANGRCWRDLQPYVTVGVIFGELCSIRSVKSLKNLSSMAWCKPSF